MATMPVRTTTTAAVGGHIITYNLSDGDVSAWQMPSSLVLETLTAYFGRLRRIEVSSAATVISFASGASLRLPTDTEKAFSIGSGPAPSAEPSSETKTYPTFPIDHEGGENVAPNGDRRWECECGARGKFDPVSSAIVRERFIKHARYLSWHWEPDGSSSKRQ
jgi:hypothetical protein